MHKCTECHKSYQTQASLKRHAHNHASNQAGHPHACTHCGTSFARRDILTRHMQKSHSRPSEHARRRCHTACEACRTARIKCDGSNPCQSCVAGQKSCRFSRDGQRVSQAAGTSSLSTASSISEPLAADGPAHILREDSSAMAVGLNESSPTALSHEFHAAASDEAFTASIAADASYTDRETWDVVEPARDAEPDAFPVDLDGLSWPRLHETLFLQDDPFSAIDLLETSTYAESPSQSNVDAAPLHSHSPLETRVLNHTAPLEINPLELNPASSHANPEPTLADEVDKIVDHATKTAFEMDASLERDAHWKDVSAGLTNLLKNSKNPRSSTVQDESILHHFVRTYLTEFNPLWPMFSDDHFKPDVLHPILYLVIASIGSMYGSTLYRQFGTIMHKRLRRLLTAGLFDLEGCDGDHLWLAHARLLIQVQGLYFGQQQGFSYAQHLGAILVAQARRLNLFQLPKPAPSLARPFSKHAAGFELLRWKQMEARLRLAFGIVRADVFTSALLNTRPLISHHEVELPLPCSDGLWHNQDRLSSQEYLVSIRAERQHYPPIVYCDLLRILLERSESKPSLVAAGYELCLFGLQAEVWQFAHSQDGFERLTGLNWQYSSRSVSSIRSESDAIVANDGSYALDAPGVPIAELASNSPRRDVGCSASSTHIDQPMDGLDTLGRVFRAMNDMKADRARLKCALESCSHGFLAIRRHASTTQHRDTLMSSMLLLHTSYMQLNTPLQKLHHVSYRAANNHAVNIDVLKSVQTWAESTAALRAAEEAVTICEMIREEQKRTSEHRARFNFFAFVGVHHAAVILWTVSELRSRHTPLLPKLAERFLTFGVGLHQRNTHQLLEGCAQMFYHLSSLGGVSFGAAAERLSKCTFVNVVTQTVSTS